MDPLLTKEVSIDVFSLTREIHTPIPPQMNMSERASLDEAEMAGKTKALFKRNEPIPDIKIYNLWSRHLSKDQVLLYSEKIYCEEIKTKKQCKILANSVEIHE